MTVSRVVTPQDSYLYLRLTAPSVVAHEQVLVQRFAVIYHLRWMSLVSVEYPFEAF